MRKIQPKLRKAVSAVKAGLAGAAVSAMLITSPSTALATGVPTVDVAAIAQAVQQLLLMVQQYEQLVAQLNQLKAHYEQLKETHRNFTGNRSFGTFQVMLSQYAFVARDIEKSLDRLETLGETALDTEAKLFYEREKLGEKCRKIRDPEKKKNCEYQAVLTAFRYSTYDVSYRNSLGHLENIKSLYDRINETVDAKGIAELQARIQNENNALQTEQMRLDAFDKMMTRRAEMAEQKQVDTFVKESSYSPSLSQQYIRMGK